MCITEYLRRKFPDIHSDICHVMMATCYGWLGRLSNFFLIITARLFTAGTLCTGFCFFGRWTIFTFILDRRCFSFLGFRRPRKYHSNHFKGGHWKYEGPFKLIVSWKGSVAQLHHHYKCAHVSQLASSTFVQRKVGAVQEENKPLLSLQLQTLGVLTEHDNNNSYCNNCWYNEKRHLLNPEIENVNEAFFILILWSLKRHMQDNRKVKTSYM